MTRAPLLCALVAVASCSRSTELIGSSSSLQCASNNAPIHLAGTDSAHCAGALAAQFGRYALCSCDDLTLTADLDVHDRPPPPAAGLPPPGGAGASGHGGVSIPNPGTKTSDAPPAAIGVSGDVTVWGGTSLNGSMIVSGGGGIKLNGGGVGGNMHSDGPIDTLLPALVGGDMYAAGNVMGPYSIAGTLHVQDSSIVGGSVMAPVVTRETVTIPTPCGCDKGPLFDIAAEVSARANDNVNDSVTFTDQFASEIDDSSATFDWPCGEYYLPNLSTGQGTSMVFRIHGHVAIFVDGDVRLGGNLNVAFDDGADLDLVVAGSFYTVGQLFGESKSPSSLRLWVASSTVSLGNEIQFSAFVYAPSAVFTEGVGVTMGGSYIVQTLTAATEADVDIYYDANAALGGQACGVAAPDVVR